MYLFSLTANFGSAESCRLHFKEERDKIGAQCKCVGKAYFWIKVFGVMHLKNVEVEFLCEMEQ